MNAAERKRILALRRRGLSIRAIAAHPKVTASSATIGRLLRDQPTPEVVQTTSGGSKSTVQGRPSGPRQDRLQRDITDALDHADAQTAQTAAVAAVLRLNALGAIDSEQVHAALSAIGVSGDNGFDDDDVDFTAVDPANRADLRFE